MGALDDFLGGSAAPVAFSFDKALEAEGVTGKLADIARSVYQQESSSGKNTKTSNAGAVGGMQIIPATFGRVADKGWSIDNPEHNARAGIRYLKSLYEQAGGDPALTAAGYYGGEGGLEKARKGIAVSDPRNPNAPNTLQYGQQVASRVPAEASKQGALDAFLSAPTPEPKAETKPAETAMDRRIRAQDAQNAGVNQRLGALLYGGAKGAADLVQAPAQIVLNGASSLLQNKTLMGEPGVASKWVINKAKQFNDHLKQQEQIYQADTKGEAAFPAGVGRVSTGIAPFILSGGATGAQQVTQQAPSFISQVPRLATQGAAFSSLTQPVTTGAQEDFAKQKLKQAAVGGAATVGGAAVGNMLARAISPNVRPDVQALLDAKVTPTPLQALGGNWARTEDKMTSLPIVGEMVNNARRRGLQDVNTAAYNRALNPIGKDAGKVAPEVGHDGVAAVRKELGAAYNDLLPKLNFRADQQFGAEMSNLHNMIANGNIPPSVATQFNSIMKNEVYSRMTRQGTMDGKNFKAVEEALKDKAKSYMGSGNPDQRELGAALETALASLRSNLSRTNPAFAKELAAINQGWANYARIRRAASSTGAESGVFTPAQLQAAVRAKDTTVEKRAFSEGKALMQDLSDPAKNILASKYPDSGTAGRLMFGALATGNPAAILPMFNPVTIGAGLLTAPMYTKMGQQAAVAALTKRPDWAPTVANAARKAGPSLGLLAYPPLFQAAE